MDLNVVIACMIASTHRSSVERLHDEIAVLMSKPSVQSSSVSRSISDVGKSVDQLMQALDSAISKCTENPDIAKYLPNHT